MYRTFVYVCLCFGVGLSAMAQQYPDQRNSRDREENYQGNRSDVIPAGTQIPVRTDQMIDARDRSDGRIYTATVAEDVLGPGGRVVIPRGARAELIVQNVGEKDLTIDLDSVTVEGRRYMVNAQTYDNARRTELGKNKRTGEYVGGGALFGAIVGAIAGGGKGAAIGAAAGGAAGAGAQVLTRGPQIRIPPETMLTFRLNQPLEVGRGRYSQDNGYDNDGYHYHNDYYHREPR
jgi:hypothetical protein